MKKLKKAIVLLLVGFGLTFGVSPQAFAAESFETGDGFYDDYFSTTSSKRNVQIDVWDLKSYSNIWGNGTYSPSKMSVRLCNDISNKCTGWKPFTEIKKGYGRVYFTNMLVGDYVVDITDNANTIWVKGTVLTVIY